MSSTLPGVRPRTRPPILLAAWAARPGGLRRAFWLALIGAVAFLPLLLVGRFPSQDGPSHVLTASTLALLQVGQAPVSALFMVPHDPGFTNALAPWLLSRLLTVLPPAQAEWVLALGLVALLLAAVLAGLRLMGGRLPDAALGVLLCAPVMLYMGSHSLVLGMGFGFLALAFAARHLESGRPRDAVLFLAAAVMGCVGNIQVAVPVLAAVHGGIAGSLVWRWLRGGRLRLARAELVLAAAALPLVALSLVYKYVLDGAALGAPAWWPQRALSALLLRGDVAWFWFSDWLLLGLLACALWALLLWWLLRQPGTAAPAPAPGATWAACGAIAVAALVVLAPSETEFVPQVAMRLAPFAHYLVFLWFCAATLPVPARRAVVALALLAGAGLTVTRSLGHAELAPRLGELEWAERQVPDGAVVDALRMTFLSDPWDQLPANRLRGFRLRFTPVLEAGYGFAGRDIANLANYQLMTAWRVFRLRAAPAVAPLPAIGWLDETLRAGKVPGGLAGHRAALREATGRDIDYILLVTQGLDTAERARTWPPLAEALRDLEEGYDRVGVSAPAGLVEVWRRKDLASR